MRRFVTPYKGYLVGSLVFNLLSAVLNVFSFMSIIPMLQMLFGIDKMHYTFMAWDTAGASTKDIVVNNMYWYTSELMAQFGAGTALLLIGLFLVAATLLKTGCYFASVAIMVPCARALCATFVPRCIIKLSRCPFLSLVTSARATLLLV